MKTEHVELGKDFGYDSYTVFIEDVPNKVGVPKQEAIDYIKKTLSDMCKIQAKKYTDLVEEFEKWDKEGNKCISKSKT